MKIKTIAILGTGGWGTALAVLWASRGNEIILWGHTPRRVDEIAQSRQNPDYLPGMTIPPNVCLTSNLSRLRRGRSDRFRYALGGAADRCGKPPGGIEKRRNGSDELHQRDRARQWDANERNPGREIPA